MDSEQQQQLERVAARIGDAILTFVRRLRAFETTTFHADDLREFVMRAVGRTAPGSADRVLRDLRARGLVRYQVINRRESLYRLEG